MSYKILLSLIIYSVIFVNANAKEIRFECQYNFDASKKDNGKWESYKKKSKKSVIIYDSNKNRIISASGKLHNLSNKKTICEIDAQELSCDYTSNDSDDLDKFTYIDFIINRTTLESTATNKLSRKRRYKYKGECVIGKAAF